jgi:Cys-tRNA(Pro)/Cys-tRNA(Cys) deacylase
LILKTNATRLLDQRAIPYEIKEYEVDPDDLSAETVAQKIGLPSAQVFKTLLVQTAARDFYFAVIPGNTELDLKALAKQTGDRKLELAPLKDLQSLTGYIRGGVTVMAAKKAFTVYLDETAILFDRISVSAGVRGAQILLDPNDYAAVTQAILAAITKEFN